MSNLKEVETLTVKEYAKYRVNLLRESGEIITRKQEDEVCERITTIAVDNYLYDIVNGVQRQQVYYKAWCGNV